MAGVAVAALFARRERSFRYSARSIIIAQIMMSDRGSL